MQNRAFVLVLLIVSTVLIGGATAAYALDDVSNMNCGDAILCDQLARHAVHAAMAGKTGLVIGFLHDKFVHVPTELISKGGKRVIPTEPLWQAVLASTGQPAVFA